MAVFAKFVVPYDPYAQDLGSALQGPSAAHILGTDRYGRDMLSRVIMGSQTTIFSALLLVVIITVVGTIVGMFCGYHGGKLDAVLMRISDVFLAFPGMVFAIAVAGVLSGGLTNAVVALACISRTQVCPPGTKPGYDGEGCPVYCGGETGGFRGDM